MSNEAESAPGLDEAAQRLASAIEALDGRLERLFERLENYDSYDQEALAMKKDRTRLARELDAAKARERELQMLADDASRVLGAAISEVRDALGKV